MRGSSRVMMGRSVVVESSSLMVMRCESTEMSCLCRLLRVPFMRIAVRMCRSSALAGDSTLLFWVHGRETAVVVLCHLECLFWLVPHRAPAALRPSAPTAVQSACPNGRSLVTHTSTSSLTAPSMVVQSEHFSAGSSNGQKSVATSHDTVASELGQARSNRLVRPRRDVPLEPRRLGAHRPQP
jgi:hypothetical protein